MYNFGLGGELVDLSLLKCQSYIHRGQGDSILGWGENY